MIRLVVGLWLALCGVANAQLAGGLQFPGPGLGAFGGPMVSPLLSLAGSNGGPSTSATRYGLIAFGRAVGAWFSSETQAQVPWPIGGTISNLVVNFPTSASPGTYVVTLRKNGAGTALTCTVTANTCTDTTHSVALVATDLLTWEVTPASTPAANTFVQISASFTSTNNGESFLIAGGSNSVAVNSAASYTGFGGSTGNNATEALVSGLVATGGTIDNLYVSTNNAPGAAQQYIATLYKNGSATGLTCTVSGAATTTCNSTGANVPVAVVATDTISIQLCPGTHSGVGGSCTAASTATTGIYHASVRWVPTIPGEMLAMYTNRAGLSPTGSPRFGYLNGADDSENTEAGMCNVAPVAMTVKKMYVSQSTAPGGVTTRAYTLRKGTCASNTSQANTCTVTSAATSCNDTSNSTSASAGDFLDWQIIPTGSNAAMTWIKIGSVVTSP